MRRILDLCFIRTWYIIQVFDFSSEFSIRNTAIAVPVTTSTHEYVILHHGSSYMLSCCFDAIQQRGVLVAVVRRIVVGEALPRRRCCALAARR